MSTPNLVYGSYGDEKAAQSTKIGGNPIGTRMQLPDGRVYAHMRLSAVAGVAGDLYYQNSLAALAGTADVALNANLAMAAAAAIGATTVTITLGGTAAVAKDLFAGGFMTVADSAGAGMTYKIKSNTVAASAATLTVVLEPTDPIKVALAAASTKVGLTQDSADNILLNTADTVATGVVAGILPAAASASFYVWVQRRGLVEALNDNTTLIIGKPITPSAQLAGAVGTLALGSADTAGTKVEKTSHVIGVCRAPASASAKYGPVYLTLE